MVTSSDPALPRMSVARSSIGGSGNGLSGLVTDGSALIAVGSVVAGGFGIEAAKSVMANESAGRVWYFIAAAGAAVVVLAGFGQRWWRRRTTRVGIVVVAADDVASAEQRELQSEAFSATECALTMKVAIALPADPAQAMRLMTTLVSETMQAISMAAHITPDAARVNVIPTMRLHHAFWYGAQLGSTHAREVAIYSLKQGTGTPPYFHATSLSVGKTRRKPLQVSPLATIPAGDTTLVALAVDLQGHGATFRDHVVADCRARGIGSLLLLSYSQPKIPETRAAFTAIVNQICQVWQEIDLPAGARTGRHFAYFNGPPAISVAVGARLAGADHTRWTAHSFDRFTGAYDAFPPTSLAL